MKKRTCAAVAAVSVLLSAIITFQITSTTYRAKNKAELDSLKTEYESSFGGKMNALHDDFLSLYNGDVDEEQLDELSMKYFVFATGDRYGEYLTADEFAELEAGLEGDFVGIIGSTGSGKSTLISHFNGLNRPTSGRVLVDGRDLWEQGADLRSFRFLVGLVMQYPEYQLFEETCARDIAYGPRNMGLDEAEVQRRVREAAAFVGLSDELLEKSPFELSGGQKRRVAIAGVMAMPPRVLVLDEPAAGLDPEGRDTILSQIRDYHEKTGITVLLVSHSMEDIAKYANRVLVMHRAKIAMYDTVENVFARAQELLELGLSVPQVTQIFLKLRQMGLDIPADVYTIPYAVKTIQKALAAKQGGGANA